ncbi:claudin-1 [Crotalus adamanteus]|uniref:Claudin-1 n=1 Tax=Crotalus adamanteus TaxID=8729 RepID=A0AAW1BH19_CROAD
MGGGGGGEEEEEEEDCSLQATRALMVSSILLGLIGAFVAMIGMKCMKCLEDDEVKKSRMAILGGVIFIISGLASLVATSWYGNVVAQEFFNPYTPVNTRFEFGQALFIGWAASSLAILGGAFLCCWCPRQETSYPQTRSYPKSAISTGKDYV